MKISELIDRLYELWSIAGSDLEVGVKAPNELFHEFEPAWAEIRDVVPLPYDSNDPMVKWEHRDENNTEQIIVIW